MNVFFQVKFKFIIVVLFIFIASISLGIGISDTSKISKNGFPTFFFYESGFLNIDSVQNVTSDLTRFEVYTNRLVLGNLGLAQQDLFLCHPTNLGFNYSRNYYDYNCYSQKSFKYCDTRTPFSDLLYVVGSKKEQFFKMTFSYNVKKNWNFSVNFKKLRSEGFYSRQNVLESYVAISSNYKSKKNRYFVLGNIIYNSSNHLENGGIKDDSIFDISTKFSKSTLNVNLRSARKKINNRGIYLKQYFNFGRKITDTVQNTIIPSNCLILTTAYSEDRYKYLDDDPDGGFYRHIYRDSSATMDSSKTFVFENELEWRRLDNRKQRGIVDWFGVNFKIKNQIANAKQFEIKSSFNNLFIGGGLYNTYSKKNFWYAVNFNYCLQGYNNSDYQGGFEFKKGIFKQTVFIETYCLNQKQSPDFIYNRYTSNHFVWKNDFIQTLTNSLGLKINSVKYNFNLGVDYSIKSNVVYFDNNALPQQHMGQIPVFSAKLKKSIEFYDFYLDNSVVYQRVPDSVVIRLPQLVLNHSLYYERPLFKNALKLQVGISLLWFSGYYANAFMPATSQFYLQNDRKIGNYPFIDFFVNAQIKTVRLFIKIDHLNSGMSGSNYFVANHYPLNDRAFKFGISWRFFD